MAQADVEIVREFTQRFAAGGHVTDDYFDPEIVWDTSASGLGGRGEAGRAEVVRFRLFASREQAFEAARTSG